MRPSGAGGSSGNVPAPTSDRSRPGPLQRRSGMSRLGSEGSPMTTDHVWLAVPTLPLLGALALLLLRSRGPR